MKFYDVARFNNNSGFFVSAFNKNAVVMTPVVPFLGVLKKALYVSDTHPGFGAVEFHPWKIMENSLSTSQFL